MQSTPVTTPISSVRSRHGAGRALMAAVAAPIGNITIWSVATLAGADFDVVPVSSDPIHIGLGVVAVASGLSVLIGTLALAAFGPHVNRAPQRFARLGLGLGVVTMVMPLIAQAEPGTKIALASMHLLTGLVWWLAVRNPAGSQR